MLRSSLTFFSMLAVLMAAMFNPAFAQTQTQIGSDVPDKPSPAIEAQPKRDFKRIVDDETKKLSAESFDPIKADAIHARQQQQAKKGWSTKQKVLLGAFIAGMVVLVVLLAKYGKDCIRTSPTNCNIGTDENCYCEEYAPEKP